MSKENPTPKPSLKDRIKTHLPVAAISMVIGGTAVAIVCKKNAITLGDFWISDALMTQLKEKGGAIIDFEGGPTVDIIDWAHPENLM